MAVQMMTAVMTMMVMIIVMIQTVTEIITVLCIFLSQLNGERVPSEIYYLSKVSQIFGVTRLLDYFENDDNFIIVLDRNRPCQDLFDYITERGNLPESQAQDFLEQIVSTLVKVHAAGIVHRDIKDENILVNLETNLLTIIDFGSAAILKNSLYKDCDG